MYRQNMPRWRFYSFCLGVIVILGLNLHIHIRHINDVSREGTKIATLAQEWWRLPVEQGGGGSMPLAYTYYTDTSQNINKMMNYILAHIDPQNTRHFAHNNTLNTSHGNFQVEICDDLPHHIKISGGTTTHLGRFRLYIKIHRYLHIKVDSIIDLSKDKPKTRAKTTWTFK